ncbi:DNA polymerase III subunit delta' [Alloscardovia macacae]|uniref:DNA polymerase III subunit delta n=1 Tax=Alloscardovia macacae TaxID=1160091 RepID=A0A1Y2T2Z2_9BIFI|nr:DNA polymerase III subunit delta' [Alloscardovia macacae]OTA26508.1 DNA polymerase III subunit delta' [Alloscardovia macacae]OTA29813.1 DNA polymerase III subunit delta' [Alloscardovia macacae]
MSGSIPPVWDSIVGQKQVVEMLSRVAQTPKDIAQSWLICGPAGSGRSNVAKAFAMALNCPHHGDGTCETCRHIQAGTHPDVTVLNTDGVTITISQVRELMETAEQMPVTAPWRVIIIEDVDRMTERTTNVLLKDIEEPSAHTIWLLCAPSAQDVLPTIRSRTRIVTLAVPSLSSVAQFLLDTTPVDEHKARQYARLAQGHIGIARMYATNTEAVRMRNNLVDNLVSMRRTSEAVMLAEELYSSAQSQAQQDVDEQVEREQAEFRRANGLKPKDPIDARLRGQYNAIGKKDDVSRRVTRLTRDIIDRALTTIASVYRDITVIHNGAELVSGLINQEFSEEIAGLAVRVTQQQALQAVERVDVAKRRIQGNTPVVLALEALLTSLIF